MDDTLKQTLLSRFESYLDSADLDVPEPPAETTDLYSLFVELAGLRTEVRTESRLVKDALDQFRAVFDALQGSQASLQQELDRGRSDARAQVQAALRPLLLDVIDLRDRLLAALKFAGTPPRSWIDRLRRRPAADEQTWQEGLRMTLRRLDQMLLERRVVPLQMLGQPLDPRRARVVGTVADPAAGEGIVVEEIRTGFLWDEQVLRTADVIVSKRASEPGEHT